MIYALVIAVFVTCLYYKSYDVFFLINFPRGLLDIRRRLLFFLQKISHDPLSELV
jgi:hypothetical protein